MENAYAVTVWKKQDAKLNTQNEHSSAETQQSIHLKTENIHMLMVVYISVEIIRFFFSALMQFQKLF